MSDADAAAASAISTLSESRAAATGVDRRSDPRQSASPPASSQATSLSPTRTRSRAVTACVPIGVGRGCLPRGTRTAATSCSRPATRCSSASRAGARAGPSPAAKMVPAFRAVVDVLRTRVSPVSSTCRRAKSFIVEEVHDEPWWAFNYYLGHLRSRVVVNSDTLTTASDIVMLASHEVYPGHHTEHVGEGAAARRGPRAGSRRRLLLVPTPQSVVCEGIAEVGTRRSSSTRRYERSWRRRFVAQGLRAGARARRAGHAGAAAAPSGRTRCCPARARVRRVGRRGESALRAAGRSRSRIAPPRRCGSPPTRRGAHT